MRSPLIIRNVCKYDKHFVKKYRNSGTYGLFLNRILPSLPDNNPLRGERIMPRDL
jgi:hypothetical protein